MNAKQDGLDKDPSVLHSLPTRKANALASQKATKAGNAAAEIANRLPTLGARISQGDDVDDLLGNDRCGRQIGSQAREVSQPEQAHPNRCQHGQQVLQGSDRVHTAILPATATFEKLVKFFNQPATAIPAHPFPGVCDREHGDAGPQHPFERLAPRQRQRFPDAHDPRGQFRLVKGGVWDGRLDAHGFNAQLNDRIAGRMGVGGGQRKQADILGRRLSGTTFQMKQLEIGTSLRLFSHTPTILGDTDHEVRAQLLARLPKGEIAAPVSHREPLAASGNGSDAAHTLFPHLRLALALTSRFPFGGGLADNGLLSRTPQPFLTLGFPGQHAVDQEALRQRSTPDRPGSLHAVMAGQMAFSRLSDPQHLPLTRCLPARLDSMGHLDLLRGQTRMVQEARGSHCFGFSAQTGGQ